MALQDEQSWVTWLSGLGFSDQEMETYSAALASEAITEEDFPELSHDLLKSCNVLKYGHRTKMIRKASRHSSKNVNDHQQSSENYSVVTRQRPFPVPHWRKVSLNWHLNSLFMSGSSIENITIFRTQSKLKRN